MNKEGKRIRRSVFDESLPKATHLALRGQVADDTVHGEGDLDVEFTVKVGVGADKELFARVKVHEPLWISREEGQFLLDRNRRE